MTYLVNYTTPRGERRCWATQYLGAELLRPVAYRSGIYVEVYQVASWPPDKQNGVDARYVELRRMDELPRKFNPARLPA